MADIHQANTKVSKQAPLMVRIENAFDTDPALKDLLCFNETFQTIQFQKPYRYIRANQEMEDGHENELLMYLTKLLGCDIPRQKFEIACSVISMKKIRNPIKDYLNGLHWDGEQRLCGWLHKYAGVPFNDYAAGVGTVLLKAAVARIFEPGIKYDYMMILEGRTRIGKSRLLQALGGEYYLDMHLEDTNKDIIDNMRGKWIIEISELAGFGKRESDWLKAFLSRGVDRVRLSYGRRSKDYPRQSILIGSMNPSGDNAYFKDDTGNARYWPVVCGNTVDVDGLRKERDQLFAEAVVLYKNEADPTDRHLYLQGESRNIAEREQNLRLSSDPWVSDIASFTRGKIRLTTSEILGNLGISRSQMNIGETMRVGKIMKHLGWHRYKDGTGPYYTKEQKLFTGGEHEASQMATAYNED